ncbi:hypothetical protein DYBT9275_02814 [Dyadobacter sp. CECT 9275]|uniref:Peptidase C14 caspase domain-containing protein n=1 Tax=Dyadobacter helix TaxID=2822344 RepID=A0A916JDR2_9BACT|nr:caspase family protein [Dyadobacter sp. CECT 9275]CAG5002124.1 hypothetical protein DYBT9275_02814 [Dyadobacter sp. CECT 9275]
MKYHFCYLTLVLMCLCISRGFGTTYAIVAAVADYKYYPPTDGDLRYTVSDAQKFYTFLRSNAGGNIPSNQIRYMVNRKAGKAEIVAAMKYIFQFAKPEDKVIFYFSGHGDPGAFIPYDYDGSEGSLLLHREVKEIFKRCRARTKICMADACFSGSITQKRALKVPPPVTAKDVKGSDVLILMSSRPDETSLESSEIEQGLFSYFLLRGLRGYSDTNKDRKVTIQELFEYLHYNVSKTARQRYGSPQHPMAYGHFAKDLIITQY